MLVIQGATKKCLDEYGNFPKWFFITEFLQLFSMFAPRSYCVRYKLYNFFISMYKWHKLEYLVCKSIQQWTANSAGHVARNVP